MRMAQRGGVRFLIVKIDAGGLLRLSSIETDSTLNFHTILFAECQLVSTPSLDMFISGKMSKFVQVLRVTLDLRYDDLELVLSSIFKRHGFTYSTSDHEAIKWRKKNN